MSTLEKHGKSFSVRAQYWLDQGTCFFCAVDYSLNVEGSLVLLIYPPLQPDKVVGCGNVGTFGKAIILAWLLKCTTIDTWELLSRFYYRQCANIISALLAEGCPSHS